MGRMKRALRTCAFALGVMAAFASSVRADSGTSLQLGGGTAGWSQNSPALSGSGVVWTNFDGTQFDIYYQDVSVAGSTPTNLTAILPGDQFLRTSIAARSSSPTPSRARPARTSCSSTRRRRRRRTSRRAARR